MTFQKNEPQAIKTYKPLLTWPNGSFWDWVLIKGGLYKTIRADDVDTYDDYMATKVLECKLCSKKYSAWSAELMERLLLSEQDL